MGVPAVCEVNTCGVAATGRCHKCGRAFCTSHHHLEFYPGTYDRPPTHLATNRCTECEAKAVAARNQHARSDLEEQQRNWRLSIEKANSLIETIKATRKPLELLVYVGQGRRRQPVFQAVGSGWVIGNWPANFTKHGEQTERHLPLVLVQALHPHMLPATVDADSLGVKFMTYVPDRDEGWPELVVARTGGYEHQPLTHTNFEELHHVHPLHLGRIDDLSTKMQQYVNSTGG